MVAPSLRKRKAAAATSPAAPAAAAAGEAKARRKAALDALDKSSGESASSDSDNGEEDFVFDKAPRRKRGMAAAASKAKAKSHGLVGSLKAKKPPIATLVREWGQRVSDDFEPAVAELVQLLVAAAGDTDYVVDPADDTVDAMLSSACEKASFKKQRGAEWRNFAANLGLFWAALMLDSRAEPVACSIAEAASTCPIKPIRLQGTITGMMSGMGLLEKRLKLRDELARCRRLFDAEMDACLAKIDSPAKKQALEEATKELREALDVVDMAVSRTVTQAEIQTQQATNAEDSDPACETVQDRTDEWREKGRGNQLTDKARQLAMDCVRICKELRTVERKALEGRDAVFQLVATKRFRDIDPEIRAATGSLLGRWASVCPEALSASHRSKYLGWMLFDKVADVRLAALHALAELFEDNASTQGLESFVARFAPRVKGCLFDPEVRVIEAAIRLSRVWLLRGLLTAEDTEHLVECERCLFIGTEAAARFVIAAHAADMGESQSIARRLRGLCDVIVTHLEGKESQEMVTCAVQAFWEVDVDAVSDFDELVQLLAEGNLPSMVTRVLASMLSAAIEVSDSDKLPDVVLRALPGLLVKHRTDARVGQRLVDLIPLAETGSWADAALDKLLRELKWCVVENQDLDLTFSAFAALAFLADENQPGHRKAVKTVEDLVSTLARLQPTARNMAVLGNFVLMAGALARGALDNVDILDEAKRAIENDDDDDFDMLSSCIKASFALAAADASVAESTELIVKARASRDVMVKVLTVGLQSTSSACSLLAAGLMHNARVIFSPATPSLCWVPSFDLLDLADSILTKAVGSVEKGADPQDVLCAMLEANGICEAAVVPVCRAALFACRREDVQSLARVLRLLVTSDLPGMEQVIKSLMDEMKEDSARLLQAGLEAVDANVDVGELIVAKLPHKASLSEPVGRMLRRAIAMGLSRQDMSIFRGLAPFCALLKGEEKKKTLAAWEDAIRVKQEADADFGALYSAGDAVDLADFEAILMGKKPRSRTAPKTPKSSAKRSKRQPKASKGKRTRRHDSSSDASDGDEDDDDVKAPQLVLVSKSRNLRPTKQRAVEENAEASDADASGRKETPSTRRIKPTDSSPASRKDDEASEVESSSDEDLEANVFNKRLSRPATSTKKKPVSNVSSAKKPSPSRSKTPSSQSSSRKSTRGSRAPVQEEDAISEDDSPVIGFRSRINLGR